MVKLSKRQQFYLKLLVGVLLVAFVYWKIGVVEILDTIVNINLVFLFLYMILKALSFVFGALNVGIMLKPLKRKVPVKQVLQFSMLSWAMGLFAPAKLGEVSLVYFLKKKGVPVAEGLSIFFLDRFLTFIVLFVLGLFAVGLFLPGIAWAYILFFMIMMVLTFKLVFHRGITEGLIRKFMKKYTQHVIDFKKTTIRYVKKNPKLVMLNLIVTIAKWMFTAFSITVLFWSFGVNVPFFYILVIQSAVTFVTLVPITLNGIGITEPVGIFLYGAIGVAYALSASMFAVALFVTYF